MARLDDGQWSNPVFITLRAGSIGWQIGVQSTDLVLLFHSKRSVESIVREEFTLGADASVAAGPHGRGIGAGTDVQFDSEIYSYAISRGFFAGVSLEGASLQIDYSAIEAYYDDPDVSIEAILRSPPETTPDSAAKFRQVLVEYEARDTE
ncbi:MAG TPA: lipid-binding SYLF domain-containing protein [bacterium]|nr:lipid-binding SYLF domain-containing protein [bacterium]